MNNVIYVRGYSKNITQPSFTGLVVEKILKDDFNLIQVDIDYHNVNDIKEKVEFILYNVMNFNTSIIGHSLGGFISMYIESRTNVNSVLLNPSTNPTEGDLINVLPDDVKELLLEYRNEIISNLDTTEFRYKLAILGMKDKNVNPNEFINKFQFFTNNTILTQDGHRFNTLDDYSDLIIRSLY